mgnify:CR=1 FL=1
MAVDPSGRGSDETGWFVLGAMMGSIYVLDGGGYAGGFDEDTVLIPLAKKAKEWNIDVFVSESNMGSGMYTELMRPVMLKRHRCKLDEVHNNIRKEHRIIDTLEPLMARHKLIVSECIITDDIRDAEQHGKEGTSSNRTAYSLFHQMTHITYEKDCLIHDDRIDTLAIGCAYLVDSVDVDVEREIKQMADREYEDIMNREGRYTIGDQQEVNRGSDNEFSGYYSLLDT